MKHCKHCNQVKPFEVFYASSTHKSSYASWCKPCEAERNKVKYEQRKEAHLAKSKEWRDANKDSQAMRVKAWREANPEHLKHIYRNWAQRNKDKVNAKWMEREANKKKRTPCWLTDEHKKQIETEYALSAWCTQVMNQPYHVDHIVPMQGKTVSGLHVPWNLQVIPAKINQQKSNRLDAANL